MDGPVISEVGHLALRVRDVAAAEEFSTALVGLAVTGRTADSVWLTHDSSHHSIQYIRAEEDGVDHVGLVAVDGDALAEIRRRVDAAGLPVVSERPLGPGVLDGFAFETVDGFVFEVYTQMEHSEVTYPATTVRPTRFGHVNFSTTDVAAMQQVMAEILDFRVSDFAGGGAFLRCSVDHHAVGVLPGRGVLNHYAWEYTSLVELGMIADAIDRRGGSTLWGPARHGVGNNLATYVQEPSGIVVEFYSDMQRIYDEAHYVPGTWSLEGHKWLSRWAPHIPTEMFDLGLPAAKPVAAPAPVAS